MMTVAVVISIDSKIQPLDLRVRATVHCVWVYNDHEQAAILVPGGWLAHRCCLPCPRREATKSDQQGLSWAT